MGSVVAPLWSQPRPFPTLRARHRHAAAFRVLELSGEADIATVGMLTEELARILVSDDGPVVVDVTGLTFCDVACAQLLRTAQRSIPVTLCGATGSVKRVLELLDTLQENRPPRHLSLSHPVGEPSTRTGTGRSAVAESLCPPALTLA